MLVLIAAVTVLLLIYFYNTSTHGYWRKRGVPFEPPLPFVGNLLDMVLMRRSQGQIMAEIYRKHTGAFVGVWNFGAPALLVRDPALVHQVLVTDFHSFPNNELDVDPAIDPVMGNNLFCQRDARWKRSRQILSPAFTVGKIKSSFVKILDATDQLVKFISSHPGELQVKDLMAMYTSEVVAGWGLGIDGHSFTTPDPILPKMGRAIFEPTLCRGIVNSLTFLVPVITKLFRLRFIPKEVVDFFEGVIRDILKHRQKTGESQPDYLQHFIDAQTKLQSREDERVICDDDILAGVISFFVEGYETSSMVTSFLLYHLAMNPDIQAQVRAEVNAAPDLSYDAVAEMPFLQQCFMETNRMHAAIGNMSKTCAEKCRLGDVTVEPGTTIILPLWGLHNDPVFWPNPQQFDPNRFSDDLRDARPKGVYLPFGDGPRICIGYRLAVIVVKAAVARIVKEFKVVPSARTPPHYIQNPFHFMPSQKGGLYLQFVPLDS